MMKQNVNLQLDQLENIENPVPNILDESDAFFYEEMIQKLDQEQKKKAPK